MKFISRNARIAGSIQVEDKPVHEVEEIIFVDIIMRPVEPMDDIAPEEFIVCSDGGISRTR